MDQLVPKSKPTGLRKINIFQDHDLLPFKLFKAIHMSCVPYDQADIREIELIYGYSLSMDR